MDKELAKIAKYIKRDMLVKDICKRLQITEDKLYGIIELMRLDGIDIDIVNKNGEETIKRKLIYRTDKQVKEDLESDELECISICVVSDTHLGSKTQQLTLLNKVYEEADRRGINTFLHCGDLLEGDYRNKRPAHPYEIFLHGFDEQAEYAIEMYPRITNAITQFIQGTHDTTHFLNGGANPGRLIARERPDMIYLGNDKADILLGKKKNLKIQLYHPGGGVAKAYSYNVQEIINRMESGYKPKILFVGHYHKCLYIFDRNVHAFLVPCFMDKSPFMIQKNLVNIIGAYFVDVYINSKGEVIYIVPEPMIFEPKDYIKDDYKKCKKLVIK